MKTRTVAGISILLNILAIGIWADWFSTREQLHKYEGLVKKYEELSRIDSSLLNNCADITIKELTNEEFEKLGEQANELMKEKDDTTRIINQSRNELGLD